MVLADDDNCEPAPASANRKRFQFSLRSLFLITTLVAIVLGFATAWVYAILILLAIGAPLGWLAVEIVERSQKLRREHRLLGSLATLLGFGLATVASGLLLAAVIAFLAWIARWLKIPFL